MKKFKIIFTFCCVFLLFACTSDDFQEHSETQNIEGNSPKVKLTYINLGELQKDNSSFQKFQQFEQDLNTLRKSAFNNAEQFDFLIGNEKIMFTEDPQFKTYTFSLHRAKNNDFLENLVFRIDQKGEFQSYLVKYNLTDSDKNKIQNKNSPDLKDKIEVFPLGDFIASTKSKNSNTNKSIMQFLSHCYELQAYKQTDTNTHDVSILYQYVEVNCVDYFELPWDSSYNLINPNTVTAISSNINVYLQYGIPFPLRDYPYNIGNDFSSYPILDDPIEQNNINAQYFFDGLTINERKWVLINGSLYTYLLQKLTEKNWNQPYVQFAQDVIWQMTRNYTCNFTRLTSEIETELFYQAMAGAKIITVNNLCPDEYL